MEICHDVEGQDDNDMFKDLTPEDELELYLFVKDLPEPKKVRFNRVATAIASAGSMVAFGFTWFFIFLFLFFGIVESRPVDDEVFELLLISTFLFNWWGFAFGCAGIFLASKNDRPALRTESYYWMAASIGLYLGLLFFFLAENNENFLFIFIVVSCLILQPCMGLFLIVRNLQLLRRYGLPLRSLLCYCTFHAWLNRRLDREKPWYESVSGAVREQQAEYLSNFRDPFRVQDGVAKLKGALTVSLVLGFVIWGWLFLLPSMMREIMRDSDFLEPFHLFTIMLLALIGLVAYLAFTINEHHHKMFKTVMVNWTYGLMVLFVPVFLFYLAWEVDWDFGWTLHYLFLAFWPIPILHLYAKTCKELSYWTSLNHEDLYALVGDREPVPLF